MLGGNFHVIGGNLPLRRTVCEQLSAESAFVIFNVTVTGARRCGGGDQAKIVRTVLRRDYKRRILDRYCFVLRIEVCSAFRAAVVRTHSVRDAGRVLPRYKLTERVRGGNFHVIGGNLPLRRAVREQLSAEPAFVIFNVTVRSAGRIFSRHELTERVRGGKLYIIRGNFLLCSTVRKQLSAKLTFVISLVTVLGTGRLGRGDKAEIMLKLDDRVSSGAACKEPAVLFRKSIYGSGGKNLDRLVERNELAFIFAGLVVQNVFVNEGIIILVNINRAGSVLTLRSFCFFVYGVCRTGILFVLFGLVAYLGGGGNIFGVAVEGENVVDRTGLSSNVKVGSRGNDVVEIHGHVGGVEEDEAHTDIFSSFVEKIVLGELILNHLCTVHPYGEGVLTKLYRIARPSALLKIVGGGGESGITGYQGRRVGRPSCVGNLKCNVLSREAVAHLVSSCIGAEDELSKLTVVAGLVLGYHGIEYHGPTVIFIDRVNFEKIGVDSGVSGRALGSRAGEIVELKYVSGGVSSSGNGIGALQRLAVRKDLE